VVPLALNNTQRSFVNSQSEEASIASVVLAQEGIGPALLSAGDF
jgi:hypothetical protein